MKGELYWGCGFGLGVLRWIVFGIGLNFSISFDGGVFFELLCGGLEEIIFMRGVILCDLNGVKFWLMSHI